jgi:thioesterase domain-containing protein
MRGGRPKVFLLPGIFGDEPPLADFRAALADRLDFELLDYPDIDRSGGEIRDFERIVGLTRERIRSLRPTGDVHIAGYSFGGLVGFVTACRLQEEGRRVGLLALLDSRALSLKVPRSGGVMRNRDAAPGLWGAAGDAASRLLIAAGLAEIVRSSVGPIGKMFGPGASRGVRRLLLQNLRGRSLSGLTLGRFDGPLVLLRAQKQPDPGLPLDLGWSAHCAAVQTVPIHGDHNSMFRADHLAGNAELIWSEIEGRIRG